MNKQFRVFLSSSFQDMHAERDYLKYHSFAALQTELFQKGYDLKILDLRGTTTEPDLAQEEAVLRLCLDGVEECIPRMIVLMGDRYGWIPYGEGAQYPDEQAKNRAELSVSNISDAPNLDITKEEIAGRSVTHLEIYYGLKHMPHNDIFVYHRRGLPYEKMSDAQRAMYCNGFEAQQALKTEISEKMRDSAENIKAYSVGWDAENSSVTGLDELDAMIYADLKASFEREITSDQSERDTWAKDSEEILTSLAQSTMRCNEKGDYDPPPEFREKLQQILDHPGFYWVTGESGSGVTTYTAQICYSLVLYQQMQEKRGDRPVLVVKYTAESHTAAPTVNILILQLLEQMENEAASLCPPDEIDDLNHEIEASMVKFNAFSDDLLNHTLEEDAMEALLQMLRRFLDLLHRTYKVFIVLCDVDMILGDDDSDKTLYWLNDLPSDVTVVFSATEGSLTPCMKYTILRVPSLSAPLIYDIMTATAKEYGKRFSEEILELAAASLLHLDSAKALHVRVLADCLMNMTASDYFAFSGADAHLSFMRNLIAESQELNEFYDIDDYTYALMIKRAQLAYGDLAMAALSLLCVSRAPVPDSVFREALSAGLGREVSELELFSLRGYLKNSLKKKRGQITWQLAHQSLRYALWMDLDMDDEQAVAKVMLQTLRNRMADNPFIISEFLWYGYQARDATAVVDYIDAFYDNTPARRAMVFLFYKKLRKHEGNWFGYLKSSVELLCQDHDNLRQVFYALCLNAPDTQDDFDAYDELLQTYLSAADAVMPKKLAAHLHQRYYKWRITSNIIRHDKNKLLDCLRSMETASQKAADLIEPNEEWEDLIYIQADVLFAQTMLCENTMRTDSDYARECFERAALTFESLGDNGIRQLIEDKNESFLATLEVYFFHHFMIIGTEITELSGKLDDYITLFEKQSQTRDVMSALFSLYEASLGMLTVGGLPREVDAEGIFIPTQTEEKYYEYVEKMVDLGGVLYPRKLQNKTFSHAYLEALKNLSEEKELRRLYAEAAKVRMKYIKVIMNLSSNNLKNDEEVADSYAYKASLEYVKYQLSEDAENWKTFTHLLDTTIDWINTCRPNELHLSIRKSTALLLKVEYSMLTKEYGKRETNPFLQDALTLLSSLPEKLSQLKSIKTNEQQWRDDLYEVLESLKNVYIVLISHQMILYAKQIAEMFRSICLTWLDNQMTFQEDVWLESSLSEEFKLSLLSIKEQLMENLHSSKELAVLLINIMEESLEPYQKALKKQLVGIREAILAKE